MGGPRNGLVLGLASYHMPADAKKTSCAFSSALQYEGAAIEGGKGWNTADERWRLRSSNQADASVAADGYHHLEEDIALMRELGLTSYRFSICWSRVIPDGGLRLRHRPAVAARQVGGS